MVRISRTSCSTRAQLSATALINCRGFFLGLSCKAAEIHGERGKNLSGAIVEFASDVPAFLILSLQQAHGEVSKTIGVPLQIDISLFEFARAIFDGCFEAGR